MKPLKKLILKILAKTQHILPHFLLSKAIYHIASSKNVYLKNLFIRLFIKNYKVDLNESQIKNPKEYESFNDFFTRTFDPNQRVISLNNKIVSPADGTILTIGTIKPEQLFQAKNKYYNLQCLLGDANISPSFNNGSYFTIYLSPKDYHRVHMPIGGKLKQMIYVPGRLFAVNNSSCENIDNIFARNERVINIFETEYGDMAVILVGAMLVGSIITTFHGQVTPPHTKTTLSIDYSDQNIYLNKADELGYFQMGSTTIVLFAENFQFNSELIGQNVRFGQKII